MTNYIKLIFISLFIISCYGNTSQKEVENRDSIINQQEVPDVLTDIQKFVLSYPDFIVKDSANYIIWEDGTKMIFDTGIKSQDFDEILNNPDLKAQVSIPYPMGSEYSEPTLNQDPGRIRYEPFFKKMYGNTKTEVEKNLLTIYWLPSTINKKLRITKINGIAEKLQAISDELDTLTHLHKYINNPGGTYYWRKISGTNRLSTHSFGIAFDINVNHSNYWKWDSKKNDVLEYRNKIPIEIVLIFEKHGFIWGGKWYHYDTMHFEYRPELCLL